jgi:exonuclease III
MAGNNRHLSILTLNINGLNAPIERHRIANWVKKTRPKHILLTRDLSL